MTPLMWIDWGRHPRTLSLASRLQADLVEIPGTGRSVRRYLRSAMETWTAIRQRRPVVVIATNPSIVLGYLLLVLRARYGFRLVSDAHYFGVKAAGGSRIMQWLLNFYNARAELVIVTNANHAELLQSLGARTFICEDPLPRIPANTPPLAMETTKSVLLISSFDEDEPYEAACQSFADLSGEGFTLFVSGNYKKAQIDTTRFRGVRFLGFIPEEQYYSYLRSVAVVMDLTTVDDCLVCGAYEALSLKKPLVLSNTKALSDYFGGAAVFVENTPGAIGQGVRTAHSEAESLIRKADDWVEHNVRHMNERIALLKATLAALSPSALHSLGA